jgi:hypothetical protein
MSIFKKWLKKKDYIEGLADGGYPIEKFNYNDKDYDFAKDNDKNIMDLFKSILEKYPEETFDFFDEIAERGDSEINNLLKNIDKKQTRFPKSSRNISNDDEIVPSSADSGYSSGEDD